MKTRDAVLRARAVFTVLLALAAIRALAAPSPTPVVKPAIAHVRLWKTELRAFPALRVSLTPEGHHATTHDLGGGGPGYLFGEYIDLPAGRGRMEVFAGQDKKPLDGLAVDLQADAFGTVLLSEPGKAGDPPRIEWIDDGGAEPTAPAQVTVRNFVTDLKEVRVSFGEDLTARFVSGPGMLLMRGILPKVYEVNTAGTSDKGEPFQWTNEVDFRRYRRQTLLIYPDPYGRIRPRISIDGEMSAPTPDKQDDRH